MKKVLVIEDGREREVIKVACPVTDGNPHGYYVQYRDAMREDEQEYVEGVDADTGRSSFDRMNKAQLIEHLEAQGVELDGKESKAELLALCASDE